MLTLLLWSTFITGYAQPDNTDYIDPTIGNVAPFLVPTHPAMHLPNQMMRMFPQKRDYLVDQIEAFPLQITSYRRRGKMPMKVTLGEVTADSWRQRMTFDHDLEVTRPWYYSTYLIEDDLWVSYAPAAKSAIYRVELPEGKVGNLLIQGDEDMTSRAITASSFQLEEKLKFTVAGIDPVVKEASAYVYGQLTDDLGTPISEVEIMPDGDQLVISVSEAAPRTVFLRYAISYISHEQARANFEKDLSGKTFDDLVESGKAAWQEVMSQVQVEGGTESQKRSFYTGLYRFYWRMIDINEDGQYYSGFDEHVHKTDRPFYTNDSVWDSFRAMHPLRTMLNPQMEDDVLHSYTQMYEQGGWMPGYPILHGNRMSMTGYHTTSLFLDGYRKGLRDYDINEAYEGLRKNLTQGTLIAWRQGKPRRELDAFYDQHGYFPSLRPGEEETDPMVDHFEKRQPVPVTLAVSFDSWSFSQLAKELGRQEDHEAFADDAGNYQHLWHPAQRLFIPKDRHGDWVDINPKLDGGRGFRDYYDENNGWTYAWEVQHDLPGLTKLLGGKAAAEARLDQLFREPLGTPRRLFFIDGSNSTGLVGQFAMGNEPSFHIPYLYNYFGAPWKTQKRTRFLLDVWFKDNIFGYPGDEDGGGMSPWVVFTSMGIYPVTPGLPYYSITSPVFEKTSIQLENGNTFTIIAEGASKKKKYIQAAFIDGKEIHSPFISHAQIMAGATLQLALGELPNKEWGADASLPPFPD